MTKVRAKKSPRILFILGILTLALGGVILRLATLQIYQTSFLQSQGDSRTLRTVNLPAYRGMIVDRNNEPLAISTPVDSIWVNPKLIDINSPKIPKLLDLVDLDREKFSAIITKHQNKEFAYLKRHVNPGISYHIANLKLDGVYSKREYRRYYPEGEVTAHVVGFTNIDDKGQEGLELAYDDYLTGYDGKKRVLKDRLGREIEDLELIKPARSGQNVALSIDKRLQYLAYKELKTAVTKHNAKAGSAVILDVETGEVLAMVNQPAFNPNARSKYHVGTYRNRAVTDVFEPGSVIKTFSLLNVLQTGKYSANSVVDTTPGWIKVGDNVVRDIRPMGKLTLSGILNRSSNVGISKLVLDNKDEQNLSNLFHQVGFGLSTNSGFPGESSGRVITPRKNQDFVLSTLAFGYGLTVTPLQLAHAYATVGSYGEQHEVTFLKQNKKVRGEQVIDKAVAKEVINMLTDVVNHGSGSRAKVAGFNVAGKTGTSRKIIAGNYSNNNHIAVFAGLAPASKPKLACVIMIDDPQGGAYYGGVVAAPVFSNIMDGSLRILNIAPDTVNTPLQIARKD